MALKKIFIFFIMVFSLEGCMAHVSKPKGFQKPPTQPFSHYKKINLHKVTLSSGYDQSSTNWSIARKLDKQLQTKLNQLFNAEDTGLASYISQTLIIKPVILEMRYVSMAKRLFFNEFAGASAILLQTTFINSDSKKIIAQLTVYEDSGSSSSTLSLGDADEWLLERLAQKILKYMNKNL